MRGMRSPKSRAILSSDMHISPHMRPWRAEQGARTCPGLSSAARIWLSSPTCPSQLLQTARGGGEESGGHVLRETTSRGLWTSAQHASTHASRRLWARLRAAANSPLAIRRRRRSSPAQQAGSPIAPAARTRTWKIARGASPLQIKMVCTVVAWQIANRTAALLSPRLAAVAAAAAAAAASSASSEACVDGRD